MKNLLLIAFFITWIDSLKAQPYSPFDTANISWSELYIMEDPVKISFLNYFVSGDSIIGGYRYHKIFQSSDYDTSYLGAFRESNKQILYVGLDYWGFDSDTAVVLYDFSKNPDDTVYTGPYHQNIIVEIDSIPVSDGYRKRFRTDSGEYWIEGIGSTKGFLFPVTTKPTMLWQSELICFKQNMEVIYMNPGFLDCTTRITSNLNDAGVKDYIQIYPNPVERGRQLSVISEEFSITGIQLYDRLGILVSASYNTSKNGIQIDTENFSPGVYILLVYISNNDVYNMKLVIQ